MKALILLIIFTSCVPICKLQNAKLKVTGYDSRTKIYRADGLNEKCYCSFRTDSVLKLNDTINTRIIIQGSISSNIVPYVEVY